MNENIANKAYKFRLYPSTEQQTMFAKTFGCARAIWNMMLSDKVLYYEMTGESLNNTPARYKGKFPWLKEVDSLALCNVQLDLQGAFAKFYKEPGTGFPRYKKKKGYKSYTTNNNAGQIRIVGKQIQLPKVGLVRLVQHRQIPSDHKIKACTISCEASGRYFISILTEYEREKPQPRLDPSKALGLDYSSPHFYTDSQGVDADPPKFFRDAEMVLAREQRKLSRMKKGGSNYRKQRRKVAKIDEHIAAQRRDWLHNKSARLADTWDYICVEDINLRGMAGALSLGKSTNDNGFGMFRTFLSYKMADRGKQFIKISKWFPSTKACSECGMIHDLRLSDREWTCDCGAHHKRDWNAAINIRDEGLRQAV